MKTGTTIKKSRYALYYFALLLILPISARSQNINTFAGNNPLGAGHSGDGGAAINAQLNHPKSMAMDDTGNVYIADADNNCIRKVDRSGIITTFSGVVSPGFSGDGITVTFAQYDHPDYIAIDNANNIYICDADNQRIRKISNAGVLSTIVGDGTAAFLGDGGPATAAEINYPTGIALDNAGNLYIADGSNNCIRKVNAAGVITTIAGNGNSGGYTGEGGPATAATLAFPYGIAVDRAGNVFVGLYYESRICKVDPSGIITTYAGVAGGSGMGFAGENVPATDATFDSPWGIATDVSGNLYIADNANERIRKVNTAGIVTTVAGNGSTGFLGDAGPATLARLRDPVGIFVGPDGGIYIADYNNHVVRKVDGTLTHPPTFTAGHRQTLSACENASAMPVNALLAVSDADAGQIETWSVATAPLHGTLVAAYSTVSTGSTLTPTGLTYTPTASYVGTDSFRVRIYDGTASDTTTVVVTIANCSTNHPPSFVNGHSQALTVCADSPATAINTLLAVSDADAGQTETWSTAIAPVHGTLVATYSVTSTGSTLTPTGLSYTPTVGYTGTDSFRVRVNDGTNADTTTVHVSVNDCSTGVKNTIEGENSIRIFPNPNPGTFSFNLSSNQDEKVQIIITNIVGEKVKEITTTTNKTTELQLNEPTGVYFLNASTPSGKWNTKISITR